MNTRSLPRVSGQSPLDIDARRIRDRAARQAMAGTAKSNAATALPAARPWQVTWFGDMLTADKNSFGVLRLAMALLVLVSHAVFLTTGKVSAEPLFGWTGYTLGQHGVQVFFILSGILVAQSLFQSRSVTDYALARALRIFPALAVCVLLTAMVLGPLLSDLPAAMYMREKWTASYIVKTLSLSTGSAELPGLFQANPVPRAVNTSVWTLKYEVACYAILALIGLILLRVQAWRQAVAIVAFTWVMFALAIPAGISATSGERSMLQVLHYFSIFFGTGVLAYAARQWIPVHAALLLPLGAIFWMAIGTRFAVPAMALFFGYASIWLATFRFGPLRAITNANDYSYATYLYHYPVAQAVLHFAPDMHVVPLIGLTAGIVLPLAFLSWELIERPALALRKRFHRSGEQANVATAEIPKASAARVMRPAASQRPAADQAPTSKPKMPAVPAFTPTAMAEPVVASTIPAEPPAPITRTQPVELDLPPVSDTSPARVWRPMPTRRTISVMPEAPLLSGTVEQVAAEVAPVAVPPEVAVTAETMPAPKAPKAEPKLPPVSQRTFSVRKPKPAAELHEVAPSAVIPKSRMAMATKRPTATPLPPLEHQHAPSEPSRAVVPVDEDGALSRRVAPPRPTWQRPNAVPV